MWYGMASAGARAYNGGLVQGSPWSGGQEAKPPEAESSFP